MWLVWTAICLSNVVLTDFPDGDLHSVAMEALLELTSAAPPLTIRSTLTPDIQWIKVLLTYIYNYLSLLL